MDVAPGVHLIADTYVNWFLLEKNGELAAVDAGLPASWRSLYSATRLLGRTLSDLKAIVLTHAHFDHIGFAERARRDFGIPVFAHELEVDLARRPWSYQTERSPLCYAWRPGSVRVISAFAAWGAFWPEPIHELRTYQDGDVLDVPGSPRVVYTPGHTFGHCSLHLPERDALIAGDALVTLDPYTTKKGPRLVARAATADSRLALASLDRIADTGATVLLPGHGEPWFDTAAEAARQARRAGIA